MLMAATPCSARQAQRILAVAAAKAGVPVPEAAAALVARTEEVPLPARLERALRRAVRAARTPAEQDTVRPFPPGLVPNRARTEEVLARFRVCRKRLQGAPGDLEARRAMEDATYTLCVLMGRPTATEAVAAAQRLLGAA
ncbi:DUF5133 domain-containing protein [Streptomyces sp. NPDC012888]|uniref:DUF5133 domain-containing protein n=1 Tax=Streptomyces sp. NPDC012888 TaxID=3364855 RepID=UPI0036D09792